MVKSEPEFTYKESKWLERCLCKVIGIFFSFSCRHLLNSVPRLSVPSETTFEPETLFNYRLLITMGSGSSAQAYQLTAEEAAAVDTTLAQVPSLRRRVEDLEVRSLRQPEAAAQSVQETESRFPQAGAPGAPGVHDSEKLHEEVAQLKEEVRSLRQAEAAAAQRIAELESRLREAEAQNVQEPESRPPQEKSVEQPSSVGGTPSPVELMTKASQEDSLPREDARVQRDAEETGAVPRSKPMSEDQDATTAPAGDKPGDKLVEIKDSSVWDADVDIKEPISQLQFDPRSSTGKAEEVASLEAEEVQEARKAQEAAAAEEAAKCTTPHDLAKDGDDKKVFVALLSGKDCECLWLQDRTIRQLKEEAQQKLDIVIKHLIGPNMGLLNEEKMLSEENVVPGTTLTVIAVNQAAEDEKEAAKCWALSS
ncbi:unnamed protein product [Cladocopium goreaui]|uniref:Ubiquitin-like domain-containing protein n=1 Tax=Cladocopium goreaui TaxID=2562237 RepID=A0A9P1C8V5_9DINO|nr:unnamed protein product [Cladocopium goreaui]